ncbi:hypothetical protein BGX26_007128, partial [Mortierella sp. AD094]
MSFVEIAEITLSTLELYLLALNDRHREQEEDADGVERRPYLNVPRLPFFRLDIDSLLAKDSIRLFRFTMRQI